MNRSLWTSTAALMLLTGHLSAQAANLTKSPRDLCSAFNRPGVASVAGIVRENTGAPVPFATVNFEGGYTTEALADRTGCFVIRAPRNSRLTVDIRRIGFQPFSQTLDLSGDSTVFLDVRLSSVAAQITGVQVTAPRNDAMERTGFYDRMLEREKGAGRGTSSRRRTSSVGTRTRSRTSSRGTPTSGCNTTPGRAMALSWAVETLRQALRRRPTRSSPSRSRRVGIA